MEEKEIIIDGVNVAGCKYLNKVVNEEPYCNIDEEHLYTCSSDENCYYKQLKRLEQENATYKANADAVQKYITQNEQLKTHIDGLEKKNAALEAENAEIKISYINFIAKLKAEMITKDDIQDLKDTVKRFVEERNSLRFENDRLKEENYGLNQELLGYKKGVQAFKIIELKQTLQEIKEVALLGTNTYKEEKEPNSLSTWKNAQFEKILNLITKAEEV